jgi:predicted kinase
MELAVLCGLQASGKTTFCRAHLGGHAVVSKDLMPNARHKERRQRALIGQALAEGRDVVVDNTNPSVEERAPIIVLGRTYGAKVVAYYFRSVLADCVRRNAARSGRELVPEVGLFSTAARLEIPSVSEGFDELWSVRFGDGGSFEVRAWGTEALTNG